MKGFFHKLSTNMIEWKQNTFTKYTIYTFVRIGVQIWLPAQALYIHCISILHRIPQRPLSILNCSLYSYRFVHIPCICDVDKKSKIRRRPLPMKIFHSYWIQTMHKYSLDNILYMTEWVTQGHMNISSYFRIFEKTLSCMKLEVKLYLPKLYLLQP